MKLSTRLKKYVPAVYLYGDGTTVSKCDFDGEYTSCPIVLMVDCKRTGLETYSLDMADEYHRHLTKDEKCTLLPLNECPVINGKEIIMHYTSTTYKEWCNR